MAAGYAIEQVYNKAKSWLEEPSLWAWQQAPYMMDRP
jgi:hypothetical protein